jgi:PfaD family protein
MNSVSQIPAREVSDPAVPIPECAGIGWWTGAAAPVPLHQAQALLRNLGQPVYILSRSNQLLITQQGTAGLIPERPAMDAIPLVAYAAPADPAKLGDATFLADHAVNYAYMTGSMANGIASTRLVKAVAGAGLLASFGAAGLPLARVIDAIEALQRELPHQSWCVNLIHSPNESGREDALVDALIARGVRRVEASAYLALTPAVVRYRVHGIHRGRDGTIITPNRIIAKASRVEVAGRWFSPPPDKLLQPLLEGGVISRDQYELAGRIPMAQDLTVEADSGGHTDNRPAITLIPTMIALRDRLQKQYDYAQPLRVGAAGGIATPASAAAAFAMGAAYIVTGTLNQACVESGSSDLARRMLAEAEQADTAMAPAVDMFEMGVKLQVLKRGTMFAMRGNKLYEYYRSCHAIEDIPPKDRENLEKTVFRMPLDAVWRETQAYFRDLDPAQIERAERDPKHKMALIFRWYLGLSSRWANAGIEDRQTDYQIWCGPAMGAFNEWTRGTFLAQPERRHAVTVALNLIYGAAVLTRLNVLHAQGIRFPAEVSQLPPLQDADINRYLP